jgi:hypothetical protein
MRAASPLTFGRLPLAFNLDFRIELYSPDTGACSALSPSSATN